MPKISAYWTSLGLQVALIVVVVAWCFGDARMEGQTLSASLQFRSQATSELPPLSTAASRLLGCLAYAAILSGGILAVSTLWSAKAKDRSIRSIAVLCTLAAVWLSIMTQWQEISWLGHRYRSAAVIRKLEPIAQELERAWPRRDATNEDLGPFMAYPNGRPTTLILLTPLPLGEQFGSLAAIDRDVDGTLRFELSRGTDSLWFVRSSSADQSVVESGFTNGIGATYQQDRYIELDQNWSLARFQ